MKTNNENPVMHVPPQQSGSEMDAVEKIVLGSAAEAAYLFKTVKKRLVDVNHWAAITGRVMSDFCLTDEAGNPVQRKATVGDHIRINIPGPGAQTGGGYDWVRIEVVKSDVQEDTEMFSMRLRPSENPLNSSNDTAHFLTKEASSTIQVKKYGKTIYAEAHGRNEVPNTGTANTLDNIRNTLVGWGAKAGISYPQWKALIKGLLNTSNVYDDGK